MFGPSLLISVNSTQTYLPGPEFWHQFIGNSNLTEDMAIYIRGGTILTMILHEGALSLNEAIKKPLRIQIYDTNTHDQCEGIFLLQNHEVKLVFKNKILRAEYGRKVKEDFEIPQIAVVHQVIIFSNQLRCNYASNNSTIYECEQHEDYILIENLQIQLTGDAIILQLY